jgi:hypothetical protein
MADRYGVQLAVIFLVTTRFNLAVQTSRSEAKNVLHHIELAINQISRNFFS